jgi:glyoxylase I family protein
MPAIHHFAITVSNFDRALKFYEKLGFVVLFTKDTPEKRKRLALLGKDELRLEVFYYEDFTDNPASRETIGNNVNEIGPKHFALRVDSITDAQEELKAMGIPLASEPQIGDAGYHFFFIRDPDGIWIEYVQDDTY